MFDDLLASASDELGKGALMNWEDLEDRLVALGKKPPSVPLGGSESSKKSSRQQSTPSNQ